MANCCICGKKMGMFEPVSLDSFHPTPYSVCGSCSKKITLLRQGDYDTHKEFEKFIEACTDANLVESLRRIMKDPGQAAIEAGEKREREAEALRKHQELVAQKMAEYAVARNQMKVTTGFNFEGYKITQYIDVVSGECVLGTGFLTEIGGQFADLFGDTATGFSGKLNAAKKQALENMKKQCFILGGNALIGIDFDYITFSNNMIGVVANGTAVVIEIRG